MKRASFDFETQLIGAGLLAPPSVCLTYVKDGTVDGLQCRLSRHQTYEMLGDLYDNHVLFGANTAFDSAVAMADWPELISVILRAYAEGRVRDVQLDQMLIDNAKGTLGGYADHTGRYHKINYSLADLSLRHLAKDRFDDKLDPESWRLRFWELRDTPWEDFPDKARAYALEDSEDTMAVADIQQTYGDVLLDSAAKARTSLSLHLMSCWGIKTDPEHIRKYEHDVLERLEILDHGGAEWDDDHEKEIDHEGLVNEGLVRKNGTRNTKAAKKLMVSVCEELDLPIKLTGTGVEKLMVEYVTSENRVQFEDELIEKYVALDADACEETGYQLLMDYAERTSLYTVKSSKIPALWKGVDTPIQARFNAMVASGRTSCTMGKGGATNGYQLQNPERKGPVRECFVARPGTLFADADLDTFELCTVSQVNIWAVGFSHLGDAINEGKDPHCIVAGQLLKQSYEDIIFKRSQADAEAENARQGGKVANFGFWGGLGAAGFQKFARSGYGLRLSMQECEDLKAAWHEAWPESYLYFAWIKDMMHEMGTAHVVQFISKRQRGLCPFTVACNTFFQGLAADAATLALWEVSRRCYDPTMESELFGVRPVNFVHDQIISEVQEQRAHEQALEMGRVMVDACNVYLPDVPTSSTPALSKHWCKNVEAVYDAPPSDGGRLVAWDVARDAKARVFKANGKEVVWK